MFEFPRLSPDEIHRLFPAEKAPPAPETFELGLVLGGTVSAGAYTAGVLDFLVQALDRWEAAKQGNDPTVPRHNVVLKVAAGASGGAVNGAILGRIVTQRITPVTLANEPTAAPDNPFYQVWVRKLTIQGLLDPSDLQGTPLASLCNPGPIDAAAGYVVDFSNGTAVSRDWLGNPLTLFMTLTNLRGIPYRMGFQNPNLSLATVNHADFVRFGIQTRAGLETFRPDEFTIITQGANTGAGGPVLGDFARASGAFPIGFPARPLMRPLKHYNYRVAALPGDGAGVPGEVRQLVPDWSALEPDAVGNCLFLTVDGGATNNDPIELARTELVGWLKRLPRTGTDANRAVILIDPFNDKADLGPLMSKPLIEVLLPLAMGLKDQARYGTQDLAMAVEENVSSRFMITARRARAGGGEYVGNDAICSSGLGAFLGFMCEDYRRHDYFLGRANCQKFLQDLFAVPAGNPVVGGWTAAQDQAHGFTRDGNRHRRLIPLVGDAATPEETLPWPENRFDPNMVRDAVTTRVNGLISGLSSEAASDFWAKLYLWLGDDAISSALTDLVMANITDAVTALNQRT
jgi:hypothetical protein